jgi:hypothetical protein
MMIDLQLSVDLSNERVVFGFGASFLPVGAYVLSVNFNGS